MNKVLKYWLLTALTLGLMSGSVMAHEVQYDNSKEPHESPHKAEPPKSDHDSLAGAATNFYITPSLIKSINNKFAQRNLV